MDFSSRAHINSPADKWTNPRLEALDRESHYDAVNVEGSVHSDPNQAGREGYETVMGCRFRKVLCYSDSKTAEKCTMERTVRKAICLEKLGSTKHDQLEEFHLPPAELYAILQADVQHLSFPREAL
ncbi:unnamed protein product [Sphenostylis stenocarpa]|uniref:Uncharacterized protein n=1 Tax=Sphenostylis stenocarpa TaxID=92480 RepID=A0AA86SGV1_9FABA|nr:unnamed protein product [Sphenostylis stenocarpa]